ncbi:YceI family protein [Pseudophaeobacter sp.]|uniref:YceI family protein n=1 Tax=Pseudophaeobacter sp. TaxID=1971739 RepID=UPI00329A791B
MLSRRQTLWGLLGLIGMGALPAPLMAGRSKYRLDPEATKVKFGFRLNGIWQKGSIPVVSSAIELNPHRLAETKVKVTLDASAAKTGFILATQAMTGPEVLDTARHPQISFVSRQILLGPEQRLSGGAQIIGDLTLRGATLPIPLEAALYRRPGSAANDLSRLDFTLKGSLSRAAYGATGFAALVGDEVRLDIRASMTQVT